MLISIEQVVISLIKGYTDKQLADAILKLHYNLLGKAVSFRINYDEFEIMIRPYTKSFHV